MYFYFIFLDWVTGCSSTRPSNQHTGCKRKIEKGREKEKKKYESRRLAGRKVSLYYVIINKVRPSRGNLVFFMLLLHHHLHKT